MLGSLVRVSYSSAVTTLITGTSSSKANFLLFNSRISDNYKVFQPFLMVSVSKELR